MIKAIILDDGYHSKDVVVKFWDYFDEHYLGGIAYRDEIICGCCGGVFDISEIYEPAPDTLEEDPIVVYDTWVNLSSEIRGR